MPYATTEYCEMVNALAKPGLDIIQNIDPRRAHLWHMATGVAGEVGELMECFLNLLHTQQADHQHVKEEIGDTLFYITGIRNQVDLGEPIQIVPGEVEPYQAFALIVAHGCTVLDIIKKHVIYDKELDVESLNLSVCWLETWLGVLAEHTNTSLPEIAQENMDKLMRGPNARYAEGSYSDKAAQERRDKS